MKTQKRILAVGLSIITLIAFSSIEAQRKDKTRNRTVRTEQSKTQVKKVKSNNYRNDRYRTQPIRRKPHYRYPRHRRVVRTLHRNHLRFVYGGLTYFYHAGIYYSAYGDQFIVVIPPRGFRIGVLPVGYVRVMFGTSVYYYHSGIYYIEAKSETDEPQYEITSPPVGTVIHELSHEAEEVVIDGKVLLEYNDILYKQIKTLEGKTAFEVVYNKDK